MPLNDRANLAFAAAALNMALALVCATPAPAAAQAAGGGIETQQLGQLDAWGVGAVSRAQGALPENLWSGSDAGVVGVLLDRLPAVYDSPAVRDMTRRVLLSGGAAPSGDAAAASARKRFEALAKMGAADELTVMATGVGANDIEISQYAAQAELARGHLPQACARGRGIDTGQPPPFMLRLRALCSASAGDRAAADLALELARTSNAADPWYTAATAAAGGAPGTRPPAARYDTSLNVALSLAGNLRPGANPLTGASTMALEALARAENAPQPLRAQAAAMAFQRGALSSDDARAIFRAVPAEQAAGLPAIAVALRQIDAIKAAPPAQPAPQTAPAGAPVAGAAASAAVQPAAPPPSPELQIAGAIDAVLRQATSPADFAAAARFFRAEIANLNAAPDPASAVRLARASLVTGDAPLAARMIDSLTTAGIDNATLAPLRAALAAVRGPGGGDPNAEIARRIDAGAGAGARAAARDVQILAALGFPINSAAETFLLANPTQGGARADAGIMAALRVATARRSIGETALLAAIASGASPARLDAESASQLIAALRAVGLEDDARRFAVEALLAGAPS